jgi:nucleoside-diphosphate-sugar epimerase
VTRRVLVLGGTGVFGSRIAQFLADTLDIATCVERIDD